MRRFAFLFFLILAGFRVPVKGAEVTVRALAVEQKISLDPSDPVWQKAPAASIALMPQAMARPWGGGAVKSIEARALYTSKDLFVRLLWEDKNADFTPSASQSFTDACAVMLPARAGSWPSPFMGDADNAVAIWRWSAAAQKDVDAGYQAAEAAHPRLHYDFEPRPNDPLYHAAQGAGNPLAKRKKTTPVEFLSAKGYGSLTFQPEERVRGQGVWKDGRWMVVMAKSLQGTPALAKGTRIPIAFAAWDGGSGERDGMKAVSVWQSLDLEPVAAPSERMPVARGERAFRRYGCATCHGPAGQGGVKSDNAQGGLVPPINKVKEGFTEEEVKQVVRNGRKSIPEDPRGPIPPFHMNAWSQIMDEQELDDLTKYLWSLSPKTQEW